MKCLAAAMMIVCVAPFAHAHSSPSGKESTQRGSQLASEGIERAQDGKTVEGAALFGSGAASASAGASASIVGNSQSGSVVKSASERSWSGPLRVSDETVVAQPVPDIPYEATPPDAAPKSAPIEPR